MSSLDAPTEPAAVRVLIVDDRPANLLVLEAVLGPLGVAVVRANSGHEALALLEQQTFAVVLIDVRMPGMDGVETAAAIKGRPATEDVPIILLTAATTEPAQVLRAYAHGAVDYLTKPFEPEILRSKVGVFVELYRKSAEIRRLNAELQRLVEERTHALAEANHQLELRLEQLRASQEQLVHSAKMVAIGTLVAGLSHELNNPLSIILAGAQRVLRGLAADDPARPKVLSIQDAAERCGRLVRSLLDFSRKSPAPREQLEPRTLLERVVTLATQRAREREVQLAVVVGSDAEPVRGCRAELESALFNLVANAIDATPAGRAVLLRASPADRDGVPGVELAVIDSGGGIPEAILPRIFEPFFTTKPVGQGTGLGLSLARQIVEAHYGRLAVESRVGLGTTMRTWLPLASASPSAPPPRPTRGEPPGERG